MDKTFAVAAYASVVVAALSATGCYSTTIHSGSAAAPAAAKYDGKWHHNLAWGMAELSGPYELEQVCPKGWASVTTKTSFANGIVSWVTYGVYEPQTITIRCAQASPSEQLPPRAQIELPQD
jgi:hypothetical protein